tara:strand:- start:543 stop:1124 length:582 start_codon:yes stop_codon:yes gene_type:complete
MLENIKKYNIILGSNSPRRKKILEELGLKVKVIGSNIDESIIQNKNLEKVPIILAKKKAFALKNKIKSNDLLITADTIVLLKDKILTKPQNEEDAKRILSKISSKTHQVITGVCILINGKEYSFSNTTKVSFDKLDLNEIDFYIKKYKPFDKAGSYGIQEWIGLIGIKKINGSYSNVVGLPASRLYQELKRLI